ncbi:MAG: hypothetical protein ACD_60C00143G0030 [uncultured bacterium]|nr:MAG: hypothetical protein ACD_60C00143G0030 [uncultured bacterium]
MSHAIMFDTHKYIKKAKEVGFTEPQAEFQAEEIAQLIEEKLATKSDVASLKKEITLVREQLINQMTIRFGGMLIAAVTILGIFISFVGLFHK